MANPLGGVNSTPVADLGRNFNEAAPSQLQGTLKGQTVSVTKDAAAATADIAEEMSLMADKFRDKSLDKRKLKSGSELSDKILERIKKIQAIQETQAFKDLVNKFSEKPILNLSDLLRQAREFSDDIVEQFTALDLAAEYFEEQGDVKKANQLREARDKIKEQNPELIQAAENISEVAAGIIDELGLETDVRSIREGYADHVRDDGSLEKTYDYLVDTHGAENFEEGLQIQLKLLATDLGCVDQSTAPERLKSILDDMKSLKIQSAIHDLCCDTEEQLARTYPEEQILERVLMKEMLRLTDQQWVTESDFDKVPDKMNVKELAAQIFVLTSVVGIVRSIPGEVLTNDENKLNMRDAAIESLDSKIEQEVEAEAESSDYDLEDGLLGGLSLDIPGAEEVGSLIPDIAAGSTPEGKNRGASSG